MKGMRVQSIIRELRGEKIDIIEYSEDPTQYVIKALSPAKISRVTILDLADKHLEVVVEDSQLSLAIGKRGQNVRLAAKLMGWKIDIKSEEEKRREMEVRMADLVISGAPVSVLLDHGLDEGVIEKLVAADIGTVERLGAMTPEEFQSIPGIDENVVGQIQSAVVSYYGQYDEGQNNDGQTQSAGGQSEDDERNDQAPADAESIESTIDATSGDVEESNGSSEAFENIQTGILEHDIARHEPVAADETEGYEVIDLGRVEGLSGAPSTLRNLVSSDHASETEESGSIE